MGHGLFIQAKGFRHEIGVHAMLKLMLGLYTAIQNKISVDRATMVVFDSF